ncbi:sensor histidine kinase [Aliivibrio fischeri]|uniref:sensor histidine kinase n=1 Tax=Aliivibrio fischeri TaxID=668 RepID=UPI001F1C2812|nr:sensor histidine kinase [Aliivibrio fischeri]MCE7556355.1 ATP-binding protein [Aliivibrio fischeri]MCE7563082.1 ATP-binding protein [Aliivibrio fischeri]MCE7571374.1 ATP-binding protein [Aliivibrio fischeri]
MRNEQDLREQLEFLLNKDNKTVDYGMILDLASKLSEYDEKNVRFSVDGNLVKRLGEQLVAKKTTALSELIKNAYDAEAENVDVIFDNTESPGGTIIIKDDGNGMTKEALIKGFMTISTSDKEENPVSNRYERPRAGRKGIGRFSAQKIGEKLRIITRTDSSKPFLVIDIDWSAYKAKSNLLVVANSIIESDDDFGFEKGTQLVISGTRESWRENNLSTTFKYISSVIKVMPKTLDSGIVDPGFNVIFYSRIALSGEILPIKSDETELWSEADAVINAYINDEGKVSVSIKGIKINSIEENYELPEVKSSSLQQAKFKLNAHYFSLARGTKRSHVQTYLRDNGGIRLYRNGFSVAPYGSRSNDWLGLDDSSRRRLILGPHANTNFIGSVEIVDTEGTRFEETSSREGLIENECFEELQHSLYEVIRSAVNIITSARGRKVTSSQQNYIAPEKTLEEKIQINLAKIQTSLAGITQTAVEEFVDENLDLFDDKKIENTAVVPLNTDAQIIINEQIELVKELADEKNMYRILASSGLAIAEFTHEIQLYLNGLMLNGKQLKRYVKSNERALRSASEIDSNINMLVSYTDFFTETIRSNSQRTKNVLELRDVFNMFFNAMNPTIKRRAYKVDLTFEGDDFWVKPMHISELSSILMNLFTNACKAIARSGQPKGMLKIAIISTDTDHIIRFEDNGDGIPKENWGRVFNALFTTDLSQGPFATEREQMRGMGLGLTITNDIISEVDGEISIVEASSGYRTCVQVVLPKANDNEVPEDVY